MKGLFNDARFAAVGHVVTIACSIALQAMLARLLGTEGRGQYAVCVSSFAMLLMLAWTIGQEMANVYFIGSGRMNPSEALSQSIIMALGSSLLAIGVGYALTYLPLAFFDKAPLHLYRLSLLTITPAISLLFLSRILLGKGSVKDFTIVTGGSAILGVACLAVVAVFGATPDRAVIAYIVSQWFAVFFCLVLLRDRYQVRLVRVSLGRIRQSLGYGVRFYLGKLCSLANAQLGTIVLAFMAVDAALIGIYATAVAMVTKLWIVPDALQVAILPRVSAGGKDCIEQTARSVRIAVAVTGIGAIGFAILARPIVMLVLSSRFEAAVIPILLILPGAAIRTVARILPGHFNGINRPGITSLAVMAGLVSGGFLLVVLVPSWGLAGAAVGTSVSYLVEVSVMVIAFRRITGASLRQLLVVKREDIRMVCDRVWKKRRMDLPDRMSMPELKSIHDET